MSFRNFVFILFLSLISLFGFAQKTALSVNDVLEKTQSVFTNTPNYTVDLNYKMFGNYTKKTPMEAFDGNMVKKNKDTYLKINNTVFLTSETKKVNVKIFEEEKAIEVSHSDKNALMTNSPVYITSFIKLFKYKDIKDMGSHYLCTLTTDEITQLPYGRIELHINKDNFVVTKQVLYFLAEYPYVDENGVQQKGNPRMEVTLYNFQTKITEDSKGITHVSKYILKVGDHYRPSATYKEFKIIQN